MLKYCVTKDGNLIAQFLDKRDAIKFSKEMDADLFLLGFKEISKDITQKNKNNSKEQEKSTEIIKPKRKRRTKAEIEEARRLEVLKK